MRITILRTWVYFNWVQQYACKFIKSWATCWLMDGFVCINYKVECTRVLKNGKINALYLNYLTQSQDEVEE